MSNAAGPRSSAVLRVIRAVLVFDTVALLFAAALHVAGARIPLGSAEFVEPQIVPAAIVEGLAGLIFAVAAYASFAGARWAWPMALLWSGSSPHAAAPVRSTASTISSCWRSSLPAWCCS